MRLVFLQGKCPEVSQAPHLRQPAGESAILWFGLPGWISTIKNKVFVMTVVEPSSLIKINAFHSECTKCRDFSAIAVAIFRRGPKKSQRLFGPQSHFKCFFPPGSLAISCGEKSQAVAILFAIF